VSRVPRRHDDRGSAVVELVVMAPVLFAFVVAVVFAGRLTAGRARIEAAARSAARTVSIARDPEAATAVAERQATEMAGFGSPMCRTIEVEQTFDRAADPVVVTVSITCVADLTDLAFLDVGRIDNTFTATAAEVLDRYREEP
jgi:Flp pilus assembly protein TadG